jgi:hypothetical protein
MSVELVPLCTVEAETRPPVMIGDGPAGTRMIVEVERLRVEGERLRGTAAGAAGGDWVTVSPAGVATLDVRLTFTTHDGALVLVQYNGRMDARPPREERVVHVAPRFETGDERYAWLNLVQAVGVGRFVEGGVRYEWFEVR